MNIDFEPWGGTPVADERKKMWVKEQVEFLAAHPDVHDTFTMSGDTLVLTRRFSDGRFMSYDLFVRGTAVVTP